MIQLSFSINTWQHLYSLQQAITFNTQFSGQTLTIKGRILNHDFLHHQDTNITIEFIQTHDLPKYTKTENDQTILGDIWLNQSTLTASIKVDARVFKELRNNILEYADIEGIQIVVSLGIHSSEPQWPDGHSLPLINLDYAMKGDA